MLKQNEIRMNSIIIGQVQKKNTIIIEEDEVTSPKAKEEE